MSNQQKKVKILLLDLGGVLFQLNWKTMLNGLGNPLNPDQIPELIHLPFLQSFERGEITSKEFFTQCITHFSLDLTFENFKKAWGDVIGEVVPNVESVLKRVKIPLFALTNTNEIHYSKIQGQKIMSLFDNIFASHLMHKRKPEMDMFRTALNSMAVEPSEILFIDDTKMNLDGANLIGLKNEFCFNSSIDLENILLKYDLI